MYCTSIPYMYTMEVLYCVIRFHEEGRVDFDEDAYIAAGSSSSEKAWREIVCRMQYFSTVSYYS